MASAGSTLVSCPASHAANRLLCRVLKARSLSHSSFVSAARLQQTTARLSALLVHISKTWPDLQSARNPTRQQVVLEQPTTHL